MVKQDSRWNAIRTEILDPIRTRLYRRILASIAYHPLLVLLFVVLLSIYLTHWLGFWITATIAAAGWSLFWWIRFQTSTDTQHTLPLSFVWMTLIGIAYASRHENQADAVDRQLIQWREFCQEASGDGWNPQAWAPLIARGTIEQTLRFRQASIPNTHHSDHDTSEDWQTTTILQVSEILHHDSFKDLNVKVSLLIDGKTADFLPGDNVEVLGHWRVPPEPSNPGQFDLRKRAAELQIAAQIKTEASQGIRLICRSHPWRLDRWLAWWTQASLVAIDRYVILDQAPLTAALVLGQREQTDWQFQEQMLATGTIHMLSISGMHIEMVAAALLIFGSLIRIPNGSLLLATVLVCVIYALLCGANPPVARATIMLSAGCLARYLGWPNSSLNTLAFAALVILAARTSVAFEVGTQLSFLTVAVLILTFPLLRQRSLPIRRLMQARESSTTRSIRFIKSFCWESIRSSFWVSFVSAPLVWCSFHIISPISIVLNLILWLPMLIALLTGLGLALFFWLPPIAWLLGGCCGVSLWCLAGLVSLADKVPLGHFWSAAPPNWWLVFFYAIALAISLWLGTKRSSARRTLLWGLGCWFCFGFLLIHSQEWSQRFLGSQQHKASRITFFDVGHGTCVLIQSPTAGNFLYDAGKLGDHQRSYQPICQALWELGIQRLDGMILSHADSDHYNAMEGLLERFRVHRFITTNEVLGHPSQSLRSLIERVQQLQIPIDSWQSGSEISSGDQFLIQAIYPERHWAIAKDSIEEFNEKQSPSTLQSKRRSDNAMSLCLVVQFAQRRVLLPGDLENPGTQDLTAKPSLPIDILMAPHHGSLTSNHEQLIAWCKPSSIIISGSHKSLQADSLKAFSPSGQSVLHTARDHALQLRIDSHGNLQWYRWMENRWQEYSHR